MFWLIQNTHTLKKLLFVGSEIGTAQNNLHLFVMSCVECVPAILDADYTNATDRVRVSFSARMIKADRKLN